LAWLLGVSLREQFSTTASAALRSVGWGIVATLPLLAGFWWLVHSQAPTLQQMRARVDQLLRELFPSANLMELAVISALAGVTEELLFRGVVQTYSISWTTPIVGLAIASLVFGAFHAMSRLYFVLTTAVGAYLGALLLWCQDLTVPIIAHGLYDFLALAYMTRVFHSEVRDERGDN
jgi:membrane protease YdiL (CAAX protease family)